MLFFFFFYKSRNKTHSCSHQIPATLWLKLDIFPAHVVDRVEKPSSSWWVKCCLEAADVSWWASVTRERESWFSVVLVGEWPLCLLLTGGGLFTGVVIFERCEQVPDDGDAPGPAQELLSGAAPHVGHVCVVDGEAKDPARRKTRLWRSFPCTNYTNIRGLFPLESFFRPDGIHSWGWSRSSCPPYFYFYMATSSRPGWKVSHLLQSHNET